MAKLSVDDGLASVLERAVDVRISPVVDQTRPTDLLQDSGVCPECLTRNAIAAPVDFEGWGDRPRRIRSSPDAGMTNAKTAMATPHATTNSGALSATSRPLPLAPSRAQRAASFRRNHARATIESNVSGSISPRQPDHDHRVVFPHMRRRQPSFRLLSGPQAYVWSCPRARPLIADRRRNATP